MDAAPAFETNGNGRAEVEVPCRTIVKYNEDAIAANLVGDSDVITIRHLATLQPGRSH